MKCMHNIHVTMYITETIPEIQITNQDKVILNKDSDL